MAEVESLKVIKKNNTIKILEAVFTNSLMSRTEIAAACDLSNSTVSQVVGSLVSRGVLEEFMMGDSTGGRKPVYVRIKADYGCVLLFEVRRDGLFFSAYNMDVQLASQERLTNTCVVGNQLFDLVSAQMKAVLNGETEFPSNILYVGIMYQEDFQQQDLMMLFSTAWASDLVSIKDALKTKFSVPVSMGVIEKYSLDYFVDHCNEPCRNYGYINVGERITISFTVNKELMKIRGKTSFDITNLLTRDGAVNSIFDHQIMRNKTLELSLQAKAKTIDETVDGIVSVIRNSAIFFQPEAVFIGGSEKARQIEEKVSSILGHITPVKYVSVDADHAKKMFISHLRGKALSSMVVV